MTATYICAQGRTYISLGRSRTHHITLKTSKDPEEPQTTYLPPSYGYLTRLTITIGRERV
jgi:hypothetical protein